MRIFVDTSSLFKKYFNEPGSDRFEELISKASEILVSPITWLEINAALERTLRKNYLSLEKVDLLRVEAKKDFAYFSVAAWNENIENKAIEVVRKYSLKSMDAIQLASGALVEPDTFVTSDQQLYAAAKKALRNTELI